MDLKVFWTDSAIEKLQKRYNKISSDKKAVLELAKLRLHSYSKAYLFKNSSQIIKRVGNWMNDTVENYPDLKENLIQLKSMTDPEEFSDSFFEFFKHNNLRLSILCSGLEFFRSKFIDSVRKALDLWVPENAFDFKEHIIVSFTEE